jgi:hypothetical protein
MEYSTKTRLPLHSNGIIYPLSSLHNTLNWYNSSLIFTCTNGGENNKGLSKSLFLAINAKGGENIKPKAKGPHHHHFKIFEMEDLVGIHKGLFFNWCLVIAISSIGIFSKLVSIKTLLKTKRRISFRGSFA